MKRAGQVYLPPVDVHPCRGALVTQRHGDRLEELVHRRHHAAENHGRRSGVGQSGRRDGQHESAVVRLDAGRQGEILSLADAGTDSLGPLEHAADR